MANYNRVILLGHLTREPELSYLPSQTPVVDFGIATNRTWTTREGEKREEVCFIDCRAFGNAAENLNKYVSKGHLLLIDGRLSFDQWTAQDGSKKSKHRVTVEHFQFMPNRPNEEQQAASQQKDADSEPANDDIPF